MIECFTRQLGESSDVFVDVVVLHPQPVKVRGCSVGFICVSPRLDEFLFEIVVNGSIRSGRSGNGQYPVLRASFPFVDVRATHISEGVGDFLPWIDHDGMRGVYELIEVQLVKEVISCSSVSFKDWGFFSLEEFVISSDRVWLLR